MNILEKQGIITTWFNEFLNQHNFNILEELITTHFTFHSINNATKNLIFWIGEILKNSWWYTGL